MYVKFLYETKVACESPIRAGGKGLFQCAKETLSHAAKSMKQTQSAMHLFKLDEVTAHTTCILVFVPADERTANASCEWRKHAYRALGQTPQVGY